MRIFDSSKSRNGIIVNDRFVRIWPDKDDLPPDRFHYITRATRKLERPRSVIPKSQGRLYGNAQPDPDFGPPIPPAPRKYYPNLGGPAVLDTTLPMHTPPYEEPDVWVQRSVSVIPRPMGADIEDFMDVAVSVKISVKKTLPDGKPVWVAASEIPQGANVLETTRHQF